MISLEANSFPILHEISRQSTKSSVKLKTNFLNYPVSTVHKELKLLHETLSAIDQESSSKFKLDFITKALASSFLINHKGSFFFSFQLIDRRWY